MPRRPKDFWHYPILKQLLQQLLFAPVARRAQQTLRCERLHDQIEPEGQYPSAWVLYRITGFHSETADDSLMSAMELQQDLRSLIDALSRSAPEPPSEGEILHRPQALAKAMNVSTKTLFRWREAGLRWRWVKPADQRQAELVYPEVAIALFRRRHGSRIEQARTFDRLSEKARQRILHRAGRLAQARAVSLHETAVHLAKRTGRAVETIRLILAAHDRQHPQQAIFIDHTGPLTLEQKEEIARDHRQGTAISQLCQRFGKTRSTIRRAIAENRARKLSELSLTYHQLPTFLRDDADEVYFKPLSVSPEPSVSPTPFVADLPKPLGELYGQKPLATSAVQSMLVKMNYLKFRADRERAGLDRFEPRTRQMDRIEQWLSQAKAIGRQLVQAHLPMVLVAARRQLQHVPGSPWDPATLEHLMTLLETGNQVLYQALESFELATSVQHPFHTHLNWLMMRRFASLPLAALPEKAIRRREPEKVRQRLIDQAGESGIDLRLEPLAMNDSPSRAPDEATGP